MDRGGVLGIPAVWTAGNVEEMATEAGRAPLFKDFYASAKSHRIDVTAVDGTAWHAQLLQVFDDLQEGATYTIRFRARADSHRSPHVSQ